MGLLETGFTNVKLGAPGADGPVVDHWSAAAVRRYLDHMSAGLAPALGGRLGEKLGGPLRASFVDSLELDHANWTDDLPAEFARRRGYDLAPYLPFVLDRDEPGDDTPRADTVRRARYDFHRTVVELFQERFLATYVGWAHENGLLARMQAYGRETHVLEGSLQVDLPEGESWLWSGHDRIVVSPTVANKYVSSAAHLAGRGPVSFEAMTNAVPVFREMPEDFKLGMDQSALAGVAAPRPPRLQLLAARGGLPRVGAVRLVVQRAEPLVAARPPLHRLRGAAHDRPVVVRVPGEAWRSSGRRADEWARDGLLYQPFPEVSRPWYHYHLWQALQQAGYGTDFVSEGVLRGARVEGGKIAYGARAYDTLVVMDVVSLEPETAEAIARFGEAGGRVVFVGRSPDRAPGLKDAAVADRRVKEAIARLLLSRAGRAVVVPAPSPGLLPPGDYTRGVLPDGARRELLRWVVATMPRHGRPSRRPARGAPRGRGPRPPPRGRPRDLLLREREPDRGSRPRGALPDRRSAGRGAGTWRRARARRCRSPGGPTRWPSTSSRSSRCSWCSSPLSFRGTPARRVPRNPQSQRRRRRTPRRPTHPKLLGVTGRGPLVPAGTGCRSSPPWDVELRPAGGTPFHRRFPQLFDLSLAADDPEVAGFGGIALYRAEFDWTDETRTVLGLGTVHGVSSVRLNGKDLGARWWGRHLYDATGALAKGRNVLEVEVTTTLGNRMRSLKDNPVAKSWSWWFPPIPMGLVGPVQLMKPAD